MAQHWVWLLFRSVLLSPPYGTRHGCMDCAGGWDERGDPKLSPSSGPQVCSFPEASLVFSLSSIQLQDAGDGREVKRHGTKRRVQHSCQGPLTGARGFGGRRRGRRSWSPLTVTVFYESQLRPLEFAPSLPPSLPPSLHPSLETSSMRLSTKE